MATNSTWADLTFANVTADAAAKLNDSAQAVYTTTLLLPFINAAWMQIQNEFGIYQIEFGEKVITGAGKVTYTANASTIALDASITDFDLPIEIWERSSPANGEEWIPMQRVMRLDAPPINATPQTLGQYEFSQDTIKVNPCTVDRLIMLRYQIVGAVVAAGNQATAIGLNQFFEPLANGTAYKASITTNRADLIGSLRTEFLESLDSAIQKVINNQQAVPVPRTPFSNYSSYPDFIRYS